MKMYVLNIKQILFGFIAVVLIVSLAVCGFTVARAEKEAVSQTRLIPIYNVEKSEKVMSLSFDAAWGNEDTEQLIEILGKYNIKATFFVVGEWVDKYPESVKALSDAGHEIMNHSDTHPDMIKLSAADMEKEITSCNEKIKAITGKSPTLFRAPYGSYSNQLIETLDGLGMYCIQWNIDSLDWKNPSVDQLVKNVTAKASNGSICLFHNAAVNTPAALPQIIETLIADGYTFVPISQLIMTENYYIDHTGCQREKTGSAQVETMTEADDDEPVVPSNTQPYYGDYYMDYRQTLIENAKDEETEETVEPEVEDVIKETDEIVEEK